jgi:hypothetical protein
MSGRITNCALRVFATCLFMLTLAGLSATQKSGQARAQITPESVPCPTCLFGMVGITRGQTARLNVVNANDVPPGPCRSSAEVPPGPCRAQVDLIFFDNTGRMLARTTATLAPGHAAFLDLNGDTLERQGNRAQVRAAVMTPPPEPDSVSRAVLVATVEVFNNETGRTIVVIPAATVPAPASANDFSIAASKAFAVKRTMRN